MSSHIVLIILLRVTLLTFLRLFSFASSFLIVPGILRFPAVLSRGYWQEDC